MKPNSFDVLKTMSEESQDIRLAPLSNILRVQKVKAGTQITIGVAGDVIAGIANGDFVGGLYLADRKQFAETQERLSGSPGERSAAAVDQPPVLCGTCLRPLNSHGAECEVNCCFCDKTLAEHFDEKDYPYHGNLPRVACLMLKTNFNLRKDGA